ncbi:radical SAM protein [Thermodesulfobacteriota bacterium]
MQSSEIDKEQKKEFRAGFYPTERECPVSNTEDYIAFLNQKTISNLVPIRSIIELTYRCNFHCIHCYAIQKHDRKDLNTSDFKDIIDQLENMGSLTMTLSGGEPLMRNDFFEIAQYARDKRFAIRIFSNGSLIDREKALFIKELKPLSIDISLYGASEETYGTITGGRDHFRQTIEGIDRLIEKGIEPFLKFPLMRENYGDYGSMKRIAGERGLKFVYDLNMSPKDDGSMEPVEHIISDEQQLECIRQEKSEISCVHRDPDDSICNAARNNIAISPYGDVFPCIQLRMAAGNCREQLLREIWYESEEINKVRGIRFKDFKECISCAVSPYCFICPGISHIERGSMTAPYTYACRNASLRSWANKTKPGTC